MKGYKRPEPEELSREYQVDRVGLVQVDVIGRKTFCYYIQGVNKVVSYLYFTIGYGDLK